VAGPQSTAKRRVVQAAIGISLACALALAFALPNSLRSASEQPHGQKAVPSLVAAGIETTEPAPKVEPEAAVLDRAPRKPDDLAAQVPTAPPVAHPTRVQMARASRAIKRADTLFERGKLGPASASYRYALANAPENAEAMAGLARVHLRRKEGGEALKMAQRLVAQHGRDSSYLLLLGDAWAQQADPVQARDAWTRAAAYGNRTALQRLRSSLEADESSTMR
jgi:tetratricopeptide (TPR) repeat protein